MRRSLIVRLCFRSRFRYSGYYCTPPIIHELESSARAQFKAYSSFTLMDFSFCYSYNELQNISYLNKPKVSWILDRDATDIEALSGAILAKWIFNALIFPIVELIVWKRDFTYCLRLINKAGERNTHLDNWIKSSMRK